MYDAVLAVVFATVTVAAPAGGAPRTAPPCAAEAIALQLDPAPGASVLSIRNVGTTACSVARIPTVTLHRADGSVLTGRPAFARFMHPGPVMLPLVLDPGVLAATRLGLPPVAANANAAGVEGASIAVFTLGAARSVGYRASLASLKTATSFDESALTTALPNLGAAAAPLAAVYDTEGPAGFIQRVAGVPRAILRLRSANGASVPFSIDATGGSDRAPNIGAIAGVFTMTGTHGDFHDAANDCTLRLDAYGPQLTLAQDGDCGFGYGVSAAGQYRVER